MPAQRPVAPALALRALPLVAALLLASCGRLEYRSGLAGGDGGAGVDSGAVADSGSDASADLDSGGAEPDSGVDSGPVDSGADSGGLPAHCNPLVGATEAECAAARAGSASVSDATLYACAAACLFGACVVYDRADCAACACEAYVKSSEICDAVTGDCGAPLDGTGCVGSGLYARAPFDCRPPHTPESEGACVLRVLDAQDLCDGP